MFESISFSADCLSVSVSWDERSHRRKATPEGPPRRRGVGSVALNLVGGAPRRPLRRGSAPRDDPHRARGTRPGAGRPPGDIRWRCGSETGHPTSGPLCPPSHVGVNTFALLADPPSRISRRETKRSMIRVGRCPAWGTRTSMGHLSRRRTGRARPGRSWGVEFSVPLGDTHLPAVHEGHDT
jgi:hypothetical protein